jgi:hypothetical protein
LDNLSTALSDYLKILLKIYELFNAGRKIKRKKVQKKAWTTPERNAALETFKKHIRRGVLPKKNECLKFLKDNRTLVNKDRSWTNVKDYVRNYAEKRK